MAQKYKGVRINGSKNKNIAYFNFFINDEVCKASAFDLDVDSRAINVFKRDGIKTVNDVMDALEDEAGLQGLGMISRSRIKNAIVELQTQYLEDNDKDMKCDVRYKKA